MHTVFHLNAEQSGYLANKAVDAVKKTGRFLWQNKGKIAATAVAVGAAVYYKDEITDFASGLLEKSVDAAEDALVSQAD